MSHLAPSTPLDHKPDHRAETLAKWLDRVEPAPSDTVRALAARLIQRVESDFTAYSYGQELVAFLRWCGRVGVEPLAASEDDALAYAQSLRRFASGTRNLKLQIARRFFDAAVGRGVRDDNPFAGLRLPTRAPETTTPALTRQQAEALLTATQAAFDDPRTGLTARRDFALMTVILRLGLRASEASSLRWGRFYDHDGHVRISFMGKYGKPAHMDLPAQVWQAVGAWKRAYERATGVALDRADPVFLPCDSRALKAVRQGVAPLTPFKSRSIHAMVVHRLADIGLSADRLSPHALRATCAVLAYHAGAQLIEIQAMLRHSDIKTTMIYLQALVGGAARAAIDSIVLDVPPWDDPDDEPPTAPQEPPGSGSPDGASPLAPAGADPAAASARASRLLRGEVARARRREPAGRAARDAERWAPSTLSREARLYLAALRADGHPANLAHLRSVAGIESGAVTEAECELLAAGLIVFSPSGLRVQRTAAGLAADLPPAASGGRLSSAAAAVLALLPPAGSTIGASVIEAEAGFAPEIFAHAVRELRGAGLVHVGRGRGRGGSLARILTVEASSASTPSTGEAERPEAA
jgi:integrase/recombinase XerD